MKLKLLGLAFLQANLIFSQNMSTKDTVSMRGQLEQIELKSLLDTTRVGERNIFIPIERLLQRTEGANIISRGNFAQDPMLRSYRNSQINVTLNGMRMFGACTDRMDPVTSYAETSNLESISVSHGGNADLDANAFGGGLNLNLKRASFSGTPKTKGSVGTSYASNTSGYNLFGQVNHQSKRWGLFVQASTKKHENYHAGGGEEIEFSQFEKINTSANLAYQLSKKEVLRINFLYDRAQDVGYPSLPMDVGIAEATVAGINYQNFQNGKYVSKWEAMAYYNSIYHEMDDTQRPNLPIHMDMPGWSTTFGAWVKAESQDFNRHKIEGKLEYYQNARRAEMTMYPDNEMPMFMLTWPDALRQSGALALMDSWQLNSKFSLTSSARIDFFYSQITTEFGKQHLEIFGYNVDDGILEPVFSWKENLTYKLNASSRLFANFAYAERSADISELYGFFLYNAHDGYDYIGNPELEKEQAIQLEVGFSQNVQNLSWSFRGYYHYVDHYIIGRTDSAIDAMTIGANGVRVYTNLPYAILMGFEASADYQLSQQWSLSATALYAYGEENTGEPLPLIAPLRTRVKVSWQNKGWYANSGWQWSNAQSRVNANFGDIPTPAYSLLSATVGKNWEIKQVQLRTELQGFNLLDHYYRDHLSWAQVPQMGRNITFKVICNL